MLLRVYEGNTNRNRPALVEPFTIEEGAMKRANFTTREGLVMLLGLTVVFIVMMWLVLAGILQIKD